MTSPDDALESMTPGEIAAIVRAIQAIRRDMRADWRDAGPALLADRDDAVDDSQGAADEDG